MSTRLGRNVTQVKPFQAGGSESEIKTRTQHQRKAKHNHALFDTRGVHIASNLDICDCVDKNCPGCHFECDACGSTKCGSECRKNRRTIFFSRKDELTEAVIRNPAVEAQRLRDQAAKDASADTTGE